ncbi:MULTISPECIES: Zn-dependent hydrolase [Oceanobacillus]|uniref:Zn-dependent hydrolase n=1 Tax=Oceanobacillus TaxID=182709 RepID=UPI00084E8FD5|nr:MULTISPECIES: Zn-dependent hydrolase [Oceanobacillus]MBT2600410.1 Zn-dependent hydrolase [Oceanobacillus sp. ISL-74]MBT2650568.1 Zn-dependent hydrolase [Oceanobacillus sp. ISL-73]OEH54889.1 allantoate amidohydrolase [Oceanobacillus sp. E9]
MEKQQVLINGERLKQMIEEFADYGRTENNGVTRLALSYVDIQVRNHFKNLCENLGLTVKWDDMGNMYARLDGIDNGKPPVVIGSHLDSVKKGGRFDGVLGVLTGLEVVQTMMENDIKPQIPIIVANFTNEEGARFEPSMMASGVISGKFDKGKMLASTDEHGITFGEALKNSGFVGGKENRLDEATGLIELHIEQGPVLEKEKFEIGVVECVVGMCCYEIEVTGDSNHAGTTPMNMREDALFATNSLINEIREKMSKLDSELVYTIGRVNVSPNIHTVIPNKVVFSIESRHKEVSVIKEVEEIIQGLSHSVPNEVCKVKTTKLWDRDTVWFNDQLVESIEKSCKSLNYSYKRMPSGAGHDAQFIATYLPAAMVFVPSVNGKSHAEDELTYWEDCEKGVNVVLQTVLDLIGF